MARGLLDSPNLDDRLWQDIVNEATALIPYYNPEWTDHNRSDLGITLVELFAWLVEGMIYRLNRVPDKNFIEFLNLIGITRDPQTPATAMLTYRMAPLSAPLLLAKGNQVATPQTDTDQAIVFETDEGVQLLPINLTTALYLHKGVPNPYRNITGAIVAAPLSGVQVSIPGMQAAGILLGFDQATTLPIALRFGFRTVATKADLQVQFGFSQAIAVPTAWPPIPGVVDGTENFTQNDIVTVTVPADWTAQDPTAWANVAPESVADKVAQPLFWIGVQIGNMLATPFSLQIDSILFNAVHASSALTVAQPELLGTSDGSPFQFFSLKNIPLYETPGTPDQYAHLVLQVRLPLAGGAFGPWTTWTRVDDFPQGPGAFYYLNPVTGDIRFGNFDAVVSPDGHGTIPPRESEVQALTYRYVAGGGQANVPPSTITVLRTAAAGVISVTNPASAANGADEETIDDTKSRGPEALRNRFRAVTAADYEYLAQEASTEVRKVRCLSPRQFTTYDHDVDLSVKIGDPWTYGNLNRDTGNVQVIVIPAGPLSDRTPAPTTELLQEVSDYLEERRTVTTALTVTGPRYLPIEVIADIRVWRKAVDTGLATIAQVKADTLAKIFQFLHPVLGNIDGTGWQVGDDQTIAPLFEFIKPPSEVGFIASLLIQAGVPLYTPPTRLFPVGMPGAWIKFADYEMVCSAVLHPGLSVMEI
jgi:baseplate J-like protein